MIAAWPALLAAVCYGLSARNSSRLSQMCSVWTVELVYAWVYLPMLLVQLAALHAARGRLFAVEGVPWQGAAPLVAVNYVLVSVAHPLIIWAYQRCSPGLVVVLESTCPIFALLFISWLDGGTITLRQWLGAVLACAACALAAK